MRFCLPQQKQEVNSLSEHTKKKPTQSHKPPRLNNPLAFCLILHLFRVEDTSNALGNNSLVLVGSSTASRNLRKNIVGSEHTSRPTSPAKVDVRVGHEVVENIADGSKARLVVRATGLGEHGLATVAAEPVGELGETGNVGAGGNAGGGGTAAVGVGVLVDVEDEVGLAAVKVGDLVQGGGRSVVLKRRYN